jgi:hypothetical protein
MNAGADSALVTQKKLIFITGASRSGTTLLSFVLRNHREVFGLKELQYFGDAWDPRGARRSLGRHQAIDAVASILARQAQGILTARVTAENRRDAAALIDGLGPAAADPAVVFAAAIQRLTQAAGKTIPCEQTPRNIFYARALLETYPSAQVVHVVRDPRAVMASQKKRWQQRRLAADGVVVPRYEMLRVWVNYHPYTVARMWSQATATAIALAEHPRFTLIKFEDLIQKPEPTVRGLCSRLALDYDPAMLDVGQINSSHQSSAGGARRGLHATAIDKWREVLSPTEIAITERDCGALMHRFGYLASVPGPVSVPGEFGQRLSYLAHLGGVVLVNPRRAYVQAMALVRSRAQASPAVPAARGAAAHGDPPP